MLSEKSHKLSLSHLHRDNNVSATITRHTRSSPITQSSTIFAGISFRTSTQLHIHRDKIERINASNTTYYISVPMRVYSRSESREWIVNDSRHKDARARL